VTNGVHAPTWISPELAAPLESCGVELAAATATWERARELDLDELGRVRRLRKEELLAAVRQRTGLSLDPDVLTIGFARRFATYKRADLLLSRREELVALLADDDQPIQLLFAGKAHPDDSDGKRMLAEIVGFAGSAEAHGRVAFLAGYDLALARQIVQGVDLWLNLPRRGEEASGTSGMKAALNGTPSLSVLDGWWDEGYAPDVGWVIAGAGAADSAAQDVEDAAELFRLLRADVRDAYEDPPRWLALGRAAIERAGMRFTSARMVAEYCERLYLPAHRDAAADVLMPSSRAPR
jgi:starch phosphorylase